MRTKRGEEGDTVREREREQIEEVVRRICASAADSASSLSSPPTRNPPLLPLPMTKKPAAQPRERRGALCVSENVALIGGSVAVMRYQPPANKRINIRRWRWTRRRRKLAWVRGWRRWSRRRTRRRKRRAREVVSPPNSRRGAGRPREASNSESHRYNASIKHSLPK